jgi:predicted type IV restriction endonuclease
MNNYSELLASLVEKVEKIKKFRDLYKQNEMAVRNQIIDPILRDLGWNTENPEEVRPDIHTEGGGFPDYTLLKNGRKILFIEAKNLSVDIKQQKVLQQLANYSFHEGVKYGVITNGAVWILIRAFEEGTTLRDRIIWEVDLENEDLSAAFRKISTLSKTNIENIEVLVKKPQILNEIWQSLLLNKPEEIIKGLIPVVKSMISQSYKDYHFEDEEIESLLKEKIEIISDRSEEVALTETPVEFVSQNKKTPQKMKLGDKVFEINNAYEILINTANWLIENGKIKPSDCPIKVVRGKRYLINTQPKHEDGSNFRASKKLSNGLWIEVHYSTADCINHAKRLLKRFGVPSELEIL